jgi:pimeloyl-ACP methyl ester carboxylesterase
VRIAYGDTPPAAPGATPIVLLHGSPGDGAVFDRLVPYLRARRVVAPDLPGFGGSSRDIPDYSFRAHAEYVDALLRQLRLERVHLLAFSMGGGAALHLADRRPAAVASLTLLSAIGVQEMELLGAYPINHALHGGQLLAVRLLGTLVPHTGLLDAPIPYARNFYDSDQRPLRGALARLRVPVLIVHGRRDPLVPFEAAREHARLVPQSELVTFDADHFMLFEDTAIVAPPIVDFLARVDRGAARVRATADPARQAAARAPFDPAVVPRATAINAMVLGGLTAGGVWLIGGVVPIGAGVLAAQGRAGYGLAILSSLAGALVRPSRRQSWRGAGATAALMLLQVAGGALLGALMLRAPWPVDAGAWTRAIAATSVAWLAMRLLAVAPSYRRRRLLLSSWRRLAHWEYWPLWAVYPPVLLWIAWLAVRHRSLTVFTAVNPAIPHSGVVGESKFAILQGLSGSPSHVARSRLIDVRLPAAARVSQVEAFMACERLALPVVLKPDAGQRGSGVAVVRTREELVAYLSGAVSNTIAQAYVPGVEFGVFYVRRPRECHGWILSITAKHLPLVTGDGRRTLEQLVLDDARALGMARFHLSRQRSRLAWVPGAGEAVSLGDCGSHCRGALFLDGMPLRTPAVEAAFDGIAGGYEGFYFGRFDVRAPSAAAFARGEFTIIELNGVTSEVTHIYDPAVGLWSAYRALFEQWSLAFEIGAENARRGTPVTPPWVLLRESIAAIRRAPATEPWLP